MFHPFQKFLPRAASHYGVQTELAAAKICHDFRMLIPEIFTNIESPHSHIQPGHYKDQTLTIKVQSPAFAQEVIMRKEKIIAEMNKEAGQEIIKNLKTQLFG